MRTVRRRTSFRCRGLPPLLVAAVSAIALLVPVMLSASTAQAAPSREDMASAAAAGSATLASAAGSIAIGVEGGDGQLWAQAPQLPAGWQPLGGDIIAPPAVTAISDPNAGLQAPVFIATGADSRLWIRSLTAGWQLLSPQFPAYCLGGPAAVITGPLPGGPFVLTVACRGTDNALWVNSAPMPTAGLPQLASPWTSLGGTLSAGPAAALIGGTAFQLGPVTYFVRESNTPFSVYTRTLLSDYYPAPWSCLGQPAAASPGSSNFTYFACEGDDGALWEATADGSAFAPAASLGGCMAGTPAVAATPVGPVAAATDLLVEGCDHAVWLRTLSSGWTSLGGIAAGGVGATALN
jgi:hypothetical protein